MTAINDENKRNQLRALVADDNSLNRNIIRTVLRRLDYEVVEASNGNEALQCFMESRFDIVLIDVMMPGLDGYEVTRRIKQDSTGRFIPVIFLTALTDAEDLARCIQVGGDDVLTTPYNHSLLQAKIQAMERFRRQNREISFLYDRMNQEQAIAEEVFSGAVTSDNVALDQLGSLLRPAARFSGDVLLTAYSPSGDLHVLLGDFTGHGLAAALGALPVSEVFRTMTAKGFELAEILNSINRKLCALLPVSMFLAAQIVSINHKMDHVTVSNCGMPEILLINAKTGKINSRMASQGLPLGIVEDMDFSSSVVRLPIEAGDRVLLVSDGVPEARNSKGEYFGKTRLEQAVLAANGERRLIDKISFALDEFCDGAAQDDDISMVEIPCIPDLLPAWDMTELVKSEPKSVRKQVAPSSLDLLEFKLSLQGRRISNSDPVPLIINQIQELEGLQNHRRILFTILTELYVNAVDHGVLGLDSTLKQDSNGFMAYYQERERRLEQLVEGAVHITVRSMPLELGGQITIRVEDSGGGFDFQQRTLSDNQDENAALHGRGIQLVQELCESLRFELPGNIVEAVYKWSDA